MAHGKWINRLLIALASTAAIAASAQSMMWKMLPGAATDIGVGADGTAWVIGTNVEVGGYGIYRWNGSNWDKIAGSAVRIAVDPQGKAWVVTSGHAIFRLRRPAVRAGGPGAANDIGIGANGVVWVIGNDKVGRATTASIPGRARTGRRSRVRRLRIAVDPQGRAWVSQQQPPDLSLDRLHLAADARPRGRRRHRRQRHGVRRGPERRTCSSSTATTGRWSTASSPDIAVDPVGRPWGVNPSRQIWASTMTPPTPTLAASGPAGTWRGGAQGGNYPANMPCPSVTYTVPADISYVQITATGGAARDGGGENVVSNLGATGATATDHGDSSPASPGFASISGGSGGRGATVTGTFHVHAGPSDSTW